MIRAVGDKEREHSENTQERCRDDQVEDMVSGVAFQAVPVVHLTPYLATVRIALNSHAVIDQTPRVAVHIIFN